jgi:hypothetical protein
MAGIAAAPARVVSTIQSNPIPAIMIGAGLSWLLLGQGMSGLADSLFVQRGRRRLGKLGETFGASFQEAAGNTAGAVRHAASSVREGFSSIGEYTHEGVDALRRTARRNVESVGETVASVWESHPLVICAAILAAGAAAGMLLPSTQREERTMGRASEALAQRVRNRGSKLLTQGRRLASEAIDTASREARRQGLTPRELGRKVKRVASRTKDSITSE